MQWSKHHLALDECSGDWHSDYDSPVRRARPSPWSASVFALVLIRTWLPLSVSPRMKGEWSHTSLQFWHIVSLFLIQDRLSKVIRPITWYKTRVWFNVNMRSKKYYTFQLFYIYLSLMLKQVKEIVVAAKLKFHWIKTQYIILRLSKCFWMNKNQ